MFQNWRPLSVALSALLAAAVITPAAQADERPFVLGDTAVQEDDDERVWEFATRLERKRGYKALDAELEYAFEPSFSVELGWARRLGDEERETELEVGLRKVLRDPARRGLGLAFALEVEAQREAEEGERAEWAYGTTTLGVPLSWQWERTGLWLHLTPGLQHERHEGTKPLAVLAFQQPLTRQFEAFGEWGAVRARGGLAHAGVRWWVKREKLALDLSVLRLRDRPALPESLSTGREPSHASVLLGLSVMDLSF